MQRIAHYILYNNSFTLAVVFMLVSGGTVLASNDEVREAVVGSVVSSEDTLVQVDNSYIRNVNVNSHDFRVQVESIEEDSEFYYVTYSYVTIEIFEGVWQEVDKEDILQVSKEQLGERDLGLYIAEQLRQFVNAKRQLLTETQEIERSLGENKKIVERKYAGLVGRFLDSEEVAFDGYEPVVKEPVKVVANEEKEKDEDTSVATSSNSANTSSSGPATSTPTTTGTTTPITGTSTTPVPVTDSTPPVITLNGDSSVEVEVGESFTDPGATATDERDGNLTSSIVVTGSVDSSNAGTYTLTYTVQDVAGNESMKTRTVTVIEAEPEEPVATSTPSTSASSTSNL